MYVMTPPWRLEFVCIRRIVKGVGLKNVNLASLGTMPWEQILAFDSCA